MNSRNAVSAFAARTNRCVHGHPVLLARQTNKAPERHFERREKRRAFNADVFRHRVFTFNHLAIRIHDLRHTAATLLLSQGVSPRVVMETLGHSQISLTMNTYTHVLPDLQREAAEKMGAALGTRTS